MFESFRAVRWIRTANLVLQAALFLSLFAGLNYLAGNHAWRFDLTRYRRYSLSPETLAYLKELRSPVRLFVTQGEDATSPELRGLLREYAYATESNPDGRISVEYLDVYQQRREAERLGLEEPGDILAVCGENRRQLSIDELYRVENQRRRAFRGEEALTGVILDVSSPVRKKIYFLTGHGELRPEDVDPVRGLSTVRDQLRSRNFSVDTLDLSQARQVPPDASLLIDVAPQAAFAPFEQELLRQYLAADAGRLILFLAPGYPHGLSDLLLDWGMTADDDLVCDTGADNVTEDGDLIVRTFTPHPVTQALIDYGTELRVGQARTIRPDAARAAGNGLTTTALAEFSPSAWGEVSFRLRGVPAFDPAVDIRPGPGAEPPGRLPLAVASERVTTRDNLPFSVRGGRLIVFGTGDLIANARIANAGALGILLGAVNWSVDRDTELNIPARPLEQFQIALSASELRRLRFALWFALPGAAVALGFAVYWTRRV